MKTDNVYRCFRYVQCRPGESFRAMTTGWLELALAAAPGEQMALLEETGTAHLPDGMLLRPVSYKVAQTIVGKVAPEWSWQSGRAVGRVTEGAFVLEDGRRFALDSVCFTDH